MWVKLVLLLCYLLALFFVSRLLEAAAWYEAGFLPYRILDPFALSVKSLKQLLEHRGISYTGLVEKHELSTLIEDTGEVYEGELEDASNDDNIKGVKPTQFTGGSHFYEEVEDTKDSVWIIQVIPVNGSPFLSDPVWRKLHSQVARFGVRTGIFDCSIDRKLCKNKGWRTPQLILALPKGQRAKDNVVLHSYPGHHQRPTRLQNILQWLHGHLLARINQVTSTDELQSSWLQYQDGDKESEVRLILFTSLLESPLFFLALGVKFSGRVKVGLFHVNDSEKAEEVETKVGITLKRGSTSGRGGGSKSGGVKKILPTYLVVTRERTFVYGKQVGEYLNYDRMELFLRSLRPETNDVFLLSLMIVNAFCGLNFILIAHFTRSLLWRQVVFAIWRLIKANCTLFLVWLVILGLSQLTLMDQLTDLGLKLTRISSGSTPAITSRQHWFRLRQHPELLVVTYALVTYVLTHFLYKIRPSLFSSTDSNTSASSSSSMWSDWWSVTLDSYLMDSFFRPMASLTQPMNPTNLDLEEGMEMIIERLAVPHFWLQPIISTDYIKDLPCWTHWPPLTSPSCTSCTSSSESEENDNVLSYLQDDDENASSPSSSPSGSARTGANCDNNVTQGDQVSTNSCNLCDPGGTQNDSNPTNCQCKDVTPPPRHDVTTTKCHHNNGCYHNSRHQHHSSRRLRRSRINNNNNSANLDNRPPSHVLDCTDCAICLDPYKAGAILCGLPCGHSYHQQCIFVWLARDNHHCPVCRWPTYKNKCSSLPQ